MRSFEYANPSTVKQAVALLGANAAVLAGGTDLITLMKDSLVQPGRLVNVKGIRELGGIGASGGGLRIGASATLEELLEHRELLGEYPAILDAAEGIASPQMRNMGTVGGDLLQRPRCWYFRNGFGLLARDSQGRPLVPKGDNRYHAIFGNSGPAYFVSPSSLAPALVALGARVRLEGSKGPREIAAADLFRAPQSEGEREHAIEPDEILTEVVIPASARGMRNATYEVRERQFMDWPLATASVALRMDGKQVREAHVVLGQVAPTPWRSEAAEKALAGQTLDEAAAAGAGDAAAQGAHPLSRNGYKVQLARVAVKRALLAAIA
ncbi:MAG TPA: FAD binding domain-containing protein [Candidatus Acidoferrales bacterium]|nr:FAD binding domain-containing protein [Candidatus Acidoferrales bacterium]